jgi:hypothetical protein
MKESKEKKEAVTINVFASDKIKLQEIAKEECRTFAMQCGVILRKWLQSIKG